MSHMTVDWIARCKALNPRVRNFIDGRWQPDSADDRLAKYSPRDGQLLYQFGAGDTRSVEAAVASAKQAFEDGRWSRLPTQRRKEVLHRLASLIDAHRDELALLECVDVGKPITDSLNFDVPMAAATIRFNAEAADKLYGKVYGADQSSLSYQLHRPVGVVAGIVGWNFPLVLAAGKVGAALAVGNSLVLKPSELTSFSAARVAELAIEAGVPEGVFNVIHGGPAVGAALSVHDAVDLVTFTGSTHTGKKLLIASGQSNLKRLILECGGKAPNIVFDDSPDLEAVADAIVARAFYNQGEVCSASSRVLIQDSVKDVLLPLIIERTAALSPGDPLKAETTFGALVSKEHKLKVQSYIERGEKDGARKVYESKVKAPYETGYYVPPVIFDEVSPGHRIAQEEIFGPVLSVMSFQDEEDAIQIANSTMYGLSAILWTKDLGRTHRVTQSIKSGWIVVNATATPAGGPPLGTFPIGGHKQSGIGLEGGLEGLEEYMSQTSVQIFV